MILKSNANVVCLQECTNQFLNILQYSPEIMAKYKYFGFQDFQTFYGVVILSEWPPANIYEYTYPNEESVKQEEKKRSESANRSTI